MPALSEWPPWLYIFTIIAGSVLVGLLVHAVAFRALTVFGARWERFDWMTADRLCLLRGPSRFVFPLACVYATAVIWTEPLSESGVEIALDVLMVLTILAVASFLNRVVAFAYDVALERYSLEVENNLYHRKVITNVQIARRFADVAIVIVAVAAILLSFERFQELGAGLLASAGVAGIVLGIAAQSTLSTLIAGFQIAWTQPIRVDDVVIVEGEWGRVEQITLTFVVVRIWDERRLVVPIRHFIEKPFENWTRSSSQLLGTVFLYTDYRVDFEALRGELERLCEASPHWDGRVCRVHVTNVDGATVEIRCLVSAADSSAAFELRCDVRERLIRFLQETQPDALPVQRARVESLPAEDVATALRAAS